MCKCATFVAKAATKTIRQNKTKQFEFSLIFIPRASIPGGVVKSAVIVKTNLTRK